MSKLIEFKLEVFSAIENRMVLIYDDSFQLVCSY